MSMYSVIFIVIFITIVIPFAVYFKIRRWGLETFNTVIVMSLFIYIVPKTHFKMFLKYKDEDFKGAIKQLLMPIIKPKLVLALYAKSTILAEAKYKAIESLVPTLDKKELVAFKEVLKKENLHLRVRKNNRVKVEVIEKPKEKKCVESVIKEEISNKKLLEQTFVEEVGQKFNCSLQYSY